MFTMFAEAVATETQRTPAWVYAIGGVLGGGFFIGLGTLIYTSPGKAWRMLVSSLEARVTSLEEERTTNREELAKAETELRRHRMIRSVLENLLRINAPNVLIPDFGDEEHPDVAPERRSNPAVPVVIRSDEPLR